jgi:raffinose/stachyose/melibiose transport system permease protein
MTSLKPDAEVTRDPLALPSSPTFDAFISAWGMLNFKQMIWNSAVISIGGTALALALALLPAYVLSRFKIPGGTAIFIVILTGEMIPQQAVIIPLYEELRALHLLDSLWGLILVHGVYGLPFCLLVMRGFMASIPKELEDAARVDGCSDLGIFRRVMLPLVIPGIAVAGTLNIISIWNELFFAMIFLDSAINFPVSVGLTILKQGRYFSSWNLPAAAMLIAQFPTVILYVLGYRYIRQGIFSGAVKG